MGAEDTNGLVTRFCSVSKINYDSALIRYTSLGVFRMSYTTAMMQKQQYSLTTPTHSAVPTKWHWPAVAFCHPVKEPRSHLQCQCITSILSESYQIRSPSLIIKVQILVRDRIWSA